MACAPCSFPLAQCCTLRGADEFWPLITFGRNLSAFWLSLIYFLPHGEQYFQPGRQEPRNDQCQLRNVSLNTQREKRGTFQRLFHAVLRLVNGTQLLREPHPSPSPAAGPRQTGEAAWGTSVPSRPRGGQAGGDWRGGAGRESGPAGRYRRLAPGAADRRPAPPRPARGRRSTARPDSAQRSPLCPG